MKQFIILLSLCTLFACKQATSDGKQAESPKKEGIGTDNAKPLSLVSSIIINVSTGGYPSNNKKYTFRNSHPEGDLHQVFFDFNESEGNKNLYDGTYAISMDNNQKAYELLGKVSTIENGKSFDPQGQLAWVLAAGPTIWTFSMAKKPILTPRCAQIQRYPHRLMI